MYEWANVANLLRSVRAATDDFTVRGWFEQNIIGPMLLDRLAEDLEAAQESPITQLQRRARSADES